MGAKPPVSVGRTVSDSCVPLVKAAAGPDCERFQRAIDAGLSVRPGT
ncbi:MAG: hypothetical protein QE285_06110 [Aquabacterium sp.]|nr:hypothetical protein [Aquabacterium sp.]